MHRLPIIDRKAVARFTARVVLALTVISASLASIPTHALDILIGSSQRNTFNYNASRILCRLVNGQTDDYSCDVLAAGDELHSSDQLHTLTNVQNGALDLGVIDSSVQFDAVNRRGRFEFFDIDFENIRSAWQWAVEEVASGEGRILRPVVFKDWNDVFIADALNGFDGVFLFAVQCF